MHRKFICEFFNQDEYYQTREYAVAVMDRQVGRVPGKERTGMPPQLVLDVGMAGHATCADDLQCAAEEARPLAVGVYIPCGHRPHDQCEQ